MTDSASRPGRLVRTVGAFVPGVRRVGQQVTSHAEHWRGENESSLADGRGLWVALGDSTAQGIGAPDPTDGYVGQLRRRLLNRGIDLRLVNLSVSGARAADVSEQVEALTEIEQPTMITCSVGANDLLRSPRVGATARRLETLVEQLAGTARVVVMATVPSSAISVSGRLVNRRLRTACVRHGVAIADLSRHLGPPYRGKVASDGFHPSALGYADWAAAFDEAVAESGTLAPRAP